MILLPNVLLIYVYTEVNVFIAFLTDRNVTLLKIFIPCALKNLILNIDNNTSRNPYQPFII